MARFSSDAPEVTQTVTSYQSPAQKLQVREWSLEVASGPDKGKKVSTLGSLLRVGSDETNDLVLSDTTVSRRHLEFERTPNGLLLKDLGSRNGSWLDGRRIGQAWVEPGDKVQLGKTKLLVKQNTKNTVVEISGAESFGELVGVSEEMRAVFQSLRRAAAEDMNLLIEGETGTGKELAARAVHQQSARRNGPFRVLDCSMLSSSNAEAELFGPEGAFISAEGGTLFLDEVSEVPTAVQARLLRVIDSKEIALPGGKTRPVNVRIVASTHKNLPEEVEQERFRKDLYFRVAVARVQIPPLRTRKADLPLLAQMLSQKLAGQVELSPQTMSLFEGYEWPGNVRELRNVLERGALLQQTGNTNWLDFLVGGLPKKGGNQTSVLQLVGGLPYHEAKDRVLGDFERQYFTEMMKQSDFDLKIAEEKTGLSMQSLYRLLKKNGLRLKDLKNVDERLT